MALINKLNAIGDAIREKTGKTDLLTLEQMPIEIAAIETGGGGGDLPEEAYLIKGDCSAMFSSGKWTWYLDTYGDKVTTEKITNANGMFQSSKELEEVPFDLNFDNSAYTNMNYMFSYCDILKKIGKIINCYPDNFSAFFSSCYLLRELPEFVNPNFSRIHTYNYANLGQTFNGCFSLRRIPEDLLKQLYNDVATSYSYHLTYNGFNNCFALDEIRGLKPTAATCTSNIFRYTFDGCHRVKDIIFATQDDGTPYIVSWKNQTIDLYPNSTSSVGWGGVVYSNGAPSLTASKVLQYNSGITADKIVSDDASYQALKNDPDWCAATANYSRYNHDSAVRTINSLPDTSAYLATAGGTNTIKFRGAVGAKTDGGAINTLTEAEIAVAAAKGWTVSLV